MAKKCYFKHYLLMRNRRNYQLTSVIGDRCNMLWGDMRGTQYAHLVILLNKQEVYGPHCSPEQHFLYLSQNFFKNMKVLKYCKIHKNACFPRADN